MRGISPEDYPKDKKPISARAARVRRMKIMTVMGLYMVGVPSGLDG
jgi:hypothetical protein